MADKRICSVDDCGNLSVLKGLCRSHYTRWTTYGDPLIGGIVRAEEHVFCSVSACGRAALSNGLCVRHYAKQKKYGDPLAGKEAKTAAGEKGKWLLEHVAHTGDDCLTWPFSRDKNGRGNVTVNGHTQVVSRRMCELAHGEPPTPRHEAAHNCGNGHLGCVNPNHLRWATRKENVADQFSHGTKKCKLTEKDVIDIRKLAGVETQRALGRRYGVCKTVIGAIQRREKWARLD